ncbi:MAG: 3-dehydroquinate synthase [Chlamydiales bacterium]|nr:3-dehydroquinate synthase [Chlamydiales bacterium]
MPVKEILPVNISPPSIQYDLAFGDNLLDQAFAYAKSHSLRPFLITTRAIHGLLPQIKEDKIVLPHGESIKSRAMKEKIEDALIERGYCRETCLIAVGGGALLDLAGFTASTYCRGIPYVSIPTTLIAMTDASIGGKTGVNVEEAKNWIGAFHQPRKVFIDFTLLRTLPQKEFIYGLSESVKHSLIADAHFFRFLESHYADILNRDPALLKETIYRSCLIKKGIIEKDPYETKGLRRILNFGHTIGHALETLSNYTLPHGHAVFLGMLMEAAIARRLDYLPASSYERIRLFFEKLPIALNFPDRLPYEMMTRDKKGGHRFVVLTEIGSVAPFDGEYVTHLTKETLNTAWKDVMCHC